MSSPEHLASPNHMVWNYTFALRRAVERVFAEPNESIQRQEAAVVVFLAVTVVEAFLNAYFRVLVSEAQFQEYEAQILQDMEDRMSLPRKLREWPQRLFGREIDESRGVGNAFTELRKLRNQLMHFRSSHESFSHEFVTIHGLADTTPYATLSPERARWAQETAEATVEEIFRLRGLSDKARAASMHLWIAHVPT